MVSGQTDRTASRTLEYIYKSILVFLLVGTPMVIYRPVYLAPINSKLFYLLFVILLTFILWSGRALWRGLRFHWHPIQYPIIGWILYLLGRIVTHQYPDLGFNQSFMWLVLGCLALLLSSVLKEYNLKNWVLNCLLVGSLFVSIHAILQYYGYEFPFLPWKGLPPQLKVMDTMGNPNYLAEFLLMMVPLGFFSTFSSHSNYTRYLHGIITVIMAFALWLTGSYEIWVVIPVLIMGVVVGLFFLIYVESSRWITRLKKSCFIFGGIILLIIAGNFVSRYSDQWQYLKQQPKLTFEMSHYLERFLIWEVAQSMIVQKPILGWGAGSFRTHYFDQLALFMRDPSHNAYRTSAISTAGSNANQAHNDYLQIAVDWGLIGFGLYLMIWVACFYYLICTLWKSQSIEKKGLILGLMVSFLMVLSDGMVNFPIYLPTNALYIWTLIALTMNITADDVPLYSSKMNPYLALGVFGISLWAAIVFIPNLYKANVIYKSGTKLMASGKINDASQQFIKALSYDQTLGVAHLRLAQCQLQLRKPNEAFQQAFLSFRYGSDDVERYYTAAESCLALGEPQRAYEILDSALMIYPRYIEAIRLQAVILTDYWRHPDWAIQKWTEYQHVAGTDEATSESLNNIKTLQKIK